MPLFLPVGCLTKDPTEAAKDVWALLKSHTMLPGKKVQCGSCEGRKTDDRKVHDSVAPSFVHIRRNQANLLVPAYLYFSSVMPRLLGIIAIIIHKVMASCPRPRLLYCGKLESAEKIKADSAKLADFQISNLIILSRPPFISQGTQTDDGWEEHVPHIKRE